MLPLPEPYAILRELATPFAAASVLIPNPKGSWSRACGRGRRACRRRRSPPSPGVRSGPTSLRGPTASMVQVIRNEYVTNVPVQVLGGLGNDRIQISGLLRETDALIIGSSVPLMPGTLVRFAERPGATASRAPRRTPRDSGVEAGITPPGGVQPTTSGRGGAATRRLSPPTQPQPGSVGATPF